MTMRSLVVWRNNRLYDAIAPPGFEDPLPLSSGVWAQLAKTCYGSYERAQRIVEGLQKLDVPAEEPKKRSWFGEKPSMGVVRGINGHE